MKASELINKIKELLTLSKEEEVEITEVVESSVETPEEVIDETIIDEVVEASVEAVETVEEVVEAPEGEETTEHQKKRLKD